MVKLPKRFSVGERVFAKVRGYPPWPAKIENVTDPNSKQAKYHVVFFGTKEIGTCKIEDIFNYEENKDKFSKTVRRKFFQEGLQELEEDIKKYPNPVSLDTLKDSESAENVPANAADVSEKASDASVTSSKGDEETDAGNLVIDEGDKKKALKRKSQAPITPDVSDAKKKRGRKSIPTILAENTPKQDTGHHDSQDEDSEKVSRSGRKIKPKRFHDSIDSEITIDSSRNDISIRSRKKSKTEDSNENQDTIITPIKKRMSIDSEISTDDDTSYTGRLLLAQMPNGRPVGIKLDVNRPEKFETESERARWDLSVARNAMRLKEQLESGDIDLELIRDSLDFNVARLVPEDDRKSHPGDDAEVIKNTLKLKALHTEAQIMFLDTQIRSSLGLDSANTDECLEALDQVMELHLTPLMLKKHSHFIETVKRLRRYIGNLTDWKLSEEEIIVFKQKADQIKKKAEQIYQKIKSIFEIPEGESFWPTFVKQVELFNEHTKDMTQEQIYSLMEDPTEGISIDEDKKKISSETSKTDDEAADTSADKSTVESETEAK